MGPGTQVEPAIPTSPPPLPLSIPRCHLASRMPLAPITALVAPFLDTLSLVQLGTLGPDWRDLAYFGSIPFGPGVNAGLHRRRYRSFGQPDIHRSASHDSVPGPLLCHLAWPWLTTSDRRKLCHVFGHAWQAYAAMRSCLSTTSISVLCLRRDHPTYTKLTLCERSLRFGMLHIAFDFCHGDVVRYL